MAKIHQTQIEKEVVTKVVENGFSLELSEDEAICLRVILQHIGGMPSSPRGIADQILEALDNYITEESNSFIEMESLVHKEHDTIWFNQPTRKNANVL